MEICIKKNTCSHVFMSKKFQISTFNFQLNNEAFSSCTTPI